ncbi:hypothetical protein [Ruminococcus sp.]|uniref:hypothetical protein n=1 Tax=Ruminococcus sp. TaxID=41978 RepID=UPI003FD86772
MRLKKILSLVTAISTMLVTSNYQIAFAESDFTSESKISEELVVHTDVSATSVVLVYQAMSRADYLEMYNDCYDGKYRRVERCLRRNIRENAGRSRRDIRIASTGGFELGKRELYV